MNISVHLHHVPRPVASLTNVWQVTRPLSDRWRSRFFLEVRQSHQQLGIFCFCLWPPHVKSYVACDASTQFLLRSNNLRIENESSVKPQKMFHKICGFFKVSTFFLIQTKTLEGVLSPSTYRSGWELGGGAVLQLSENKWHAPWLNFDLIYSTFQIPSQITPFQVITLWFWQHLLHSHLVDLVMILYPVITSAKNIVFSPMSIC